MTSDELRDIGMRVGDLCSFDDARKLYDYVAELRAENARLREALADVERTTTDVGARQLARAALVKP